MIREFMIGDHRRCDELFAQTEQAATRGDLDETAAQFKQFQDGMERHFGMEEGSLFPRIETITGHSQGPTAVMRSEHEQMRSLMMEMAFALENQDTEEFLDGCETLLILMQQHNIKEENILYPMADELLAADAQELVEQMQTVESG